MNALSTTHEHTKERRGKDEKNGGKKEEKDKGERGRGKERGSEGYGGGEERLYLNMWILVSQTFGPQNEAHILTQLRKPS